MLARSVVEGSDVWCIEVGEVIDKIFATYRECGRVETFIVGEFGFLTLGIYLIDVLLKWTAFVAGIIEMLPCGISAIVISYNEIALGELANELSSTRVKIEMSISIAIRKKDELLA